MLVKYRMVILNCRYIFNTVQLLLKSYLKEQIAFYDNSEL